MTRTVESRYVIARLKPITGVQNERIRLDGLGTTGEHVAELLTRVDLENYRCFWFETVDSTVKYSSGMMTCRTNVWQRSGNHFVNAYIEEYGDVQVNNPELAKQMTNLGWTHIARDIGEKHLWSEVFNPQEDKLVDLRGVAIAW